MSQKLVIGIDGLNTNSNSVSLVDGALVNLSNVNLDRKLAEGRRGFSRHSTLANIVKLDEYQNKLIAHTSDNTLKYYNSGWTSLGSITAPIATQRMTFSHANQNLYFPTSAGIKVIDAYTSTPANAGMPRGLELTYTLTAGTALPAACQVAYRVVWGTRDLNNNLYLGAPSQRNIITSSGTNKDVILTITIPSGIATTDFLQVYRGRQSGGATTEPDDEMSLVYEANPTQPEIDAKVLVFTDSVEDALKGAFLYSNANQEGASETNDIPPFALDVVTFRGFSFFSAIKTRYYIDISLLAATGALGLADDDTITINGVVFTAKSGTTIASGYFQRFTAGGVGQNVENTARELVKVINQYASNTTIYAYYESGYGELPGQIMLEERVFSGTAFTVSVSAGSATAWSIPNSGTSTNTNYPNGLMWSKIQQPEHVPTSHIELVGSKSSYILRILALKDALFIFKEDGISRLTGVNGNWTIETLDSSTILISPNSAVVLNNQIYCLTNQGVVTVSDNGVQVIGEDIKDGIQALIGTDYTAIKTVSYGAAYETDRKYLLCLSSVAGETTTTQTFVYNVFTGKWGKWNKTSLTAFVSPNVDKLYWSNETYLLEERKNFSRLDYVDEEYSSGYTVVSSSTTNVVLSSITGLTVGDVLWQSATINAVITAINAGAVSVTVDSTQSWSVAAVTILQGIDCYIEWAPQYCGNSGIEKAFEELLVMFKTARFPSATMDFYTELNGGWEQITITSADSNSEWGMFAWGEVPWGGTSRPKPVRCSVPRNKSRGQLLGIRFSCRYGYSLFSLEGLSLQFGSVSERTGART